MIKFLAVSVLRAKGGIVAAVVTAIALMASVSSAQNIRSSAADPDSEVARKHFDRGSELYSELKYEQAIVEFQAANEAKPHPDFDYNIARCFDRLGDWPHALDYYRRYLAVSPKSDDVRARVAELQTRLERLVPSPSPETAVVTPPPRPWRLRLAAITVGAAGIAALAGAGGFYGSVEADLPSRRDYCRSLPRQCVPSEWADLQARTNASYALWAVGGALVAADIVLWAIDFKHRREWRAQMGRLGLSLSMTPGWSVQF